MHPIIIIGTVRSLIVDVAMGQIPRSTERISSNQHHTFHFGLNITSHGENGSGPQGEKAGMVHSVSGCTRYVQVKLTSHENV